MGRGGGDTQGDKAPVLQGISQSKLVQRATYTHVSTLAPLHLVSSALWPLGPHGPMALTYTPTGLAVTRVSMGP